MDASPWQELTSSHARPADPGSPAASFSWSGQALWRGEELPVTSVAFGVFTLFLSNRGLCTYYRLQRYAFPLLIGLLWGLPALFHVDPIGAYFRHTVDPLFSLLVPR